MALPTPRYCLQHSRFVGNDDWLLLDLALSLFGNIAVSGYNKNSHRTYVDVYTVNNSGSKDKPKMVYSKEFEKYQTEMGIHRGRCISFVDPDGDHIVTCAGNQLELTQFSIDEVLRSRTVNGSAECLSVRDKEIFIGFYQSRQVTVYDTDKLTEIRQIILDQTASGHCPYDMTVTANKMIACVGQVGKESVQKSLIFEQNSGIMLSEMTTPKDSHWYKASVSVNVPLGLVAVVRATMYYIVQGIRYQIVFYSLLSKNNYGFLVVEIEAGINRIRISNSGDRIVTGNINTGEVKIYDTAQIFSYNCMKTYLALQIQHDKCARLTKFFDLPNDQTKLILNSTIPMEKLLLALEEKDIIRPFNVDKLMEALEEVKVDTTCYIAADIYRTIKMQPTLYDMFLAILATHLTASLPADLCVYFNIPNEKKNSITLSHNPGLSLLLALDEMNIINPSDPTALEQPLIEHRLVQAVAKIHEYQSTVEEERKNLFRREVEIYTLAEKTEVFKKYLQRKLKSWYETMTPVPWKNSCRWKSADLFVACGLILTDSKTNRNLTDIDERCKLRYTEIFSHKKLEGESRIILEGDPGSGKTMLSSQLAYDWSQGKIRGINILILLPLKLVRDKTVVESIRDFYLPEDNLSLADIEDVVSNEGNRCCFLLDGLEEYGGKNASTSEEPSEIMNIMTKKKYPSCKVVITSRSDYVQELPPCPLLKLGQFSEFERSTYIEKLFPGDLEKQLNVKEVIENIPLILHICKVPLLFVLAVHIMGDKHSVSKGQLNRVTPFIKNIMESLLTPVSSLKETSKMEVHSKYSDNLEDTLHYTEFGNVSKWVYGDDIMYSESNVRTHPRHKVLQIKSQEISLEELAFNGLCKGKQQLSWPKTFVDDNVNNIKQWMEAGILVVENDFVVVKAAQQTTQKFPEEIYPLTSVPSNIFDERPADNDGLETQMNDFIEERLQVSSEDDTRSIPLGGETMALKTDFLDSGMIKKRKISNDPKLDLAENYKPVTDQNDVMKFEEDDRAKRSTFALQHVPLQVKFLHKVIQEWFAARYLASACWRYTTLPLLKQYELLRNHLRHINPADLHYVLRFTCSLCPPCCHFILNYLLATYRGKGGNIPEHILNCICLCLAEYEDEKDDYVKDIVSEICKIIFSIHPEDSRLLKEAKIAMLHFGSSCGFPISRLQLLDVVVEANEDQLTLNTGVTMEILQTLQVLEISRWDNALKEKDYYNVMKFIANGASIKEAYLHFPEEPPMLDENTKKELKKHVKIVTWKIGSMLSKQFEISTGEWKVLEYVYRGDTEAVDSISVGKKVRTGTIRQLINLQTMKSTAVQDKVEKDFNGNTVADLRIEGFIDKSGGTLFLREADISLHVPPGALTHRCLMRITVPMDFSSCFPGLQVSPRVTPLTICEPDNVIFQLPVKLTLPHCAVIRNPDDHEVIVKYGYRDDNAREMTWKSETVDWSLGDHYCSVFLNHFSGVDVGITSTEEKILRVIPYTNLRRSNNKLTLNVWLCNDLESDFQSVMQFEETNGGIPLDSYDTFQLNCISGPGKSNVTISFKELQGNRWHFQENEDTLHLDRLSGSSKSKSSFLLQRNDGEDDASYMYLLLKITQMVGQDERDTTFAIRKMICDLKTPALFKKPCCQYENRTDHPLPTEKEKQTRTCTAVVYMDPVRNLEDDAILTLWLSPFDSNSEEFQFLQEEQKLQLKHRVDTVNSFLVFFDKVTVVSNTRFLNGKWILSPEEKKIETDRIRFGSRVKFQFIGRKKEKIDADYIDLEVEVFQEDKCKIKFMTDVEMKDLFYEIRRRQIKESTASASEEPSSFSSKVKSDVPQLSIAKSLQVTHTTRRTPDTQEAASNAPPSQSEEHSGKSEERLRKCFMLLKRNLAKDWMDFGRYLNLPDDELKCLSKEYKDDIGEIIYQMLLSWQQKNGSAATPEKLIEALKDLNRKDLEEKLEKM